MNILELLKVVKDDKLEQPQLEKYRDALSNVASDIQIELGRYQKAEAMFMFQKKDGQSVADRKVEWKATEEGQRLIELKNYSTSAKIMLKSLRDRLYAFY